MSGEVEWCPILHVRPKFDGFTLMDERTDGGDCNIPDAFFCFLALQPFY